MAQDPMLSGMVFLFAIFGIPKLMAYMPDFDPLMLIVGAFVLVAALQQLGFASANAGADAGADAGAGDEGTTARQRQAARKQRSQGGSATSSTESSRKPNAEDLLANAERSLQQNNYKRVEELAKEITDQDPENGRAWELLALAQKWEGRRDEAVATVKKARELYECDTKGLKALAKELEASHDPSAMAAECEQKGEIFFTKRQYDLACDCYTKALDALSGEDTALVDLRLRLLRRRAECAQQLQDWSLCRRDATALLEHDPNNKTALLQRAAANESLEKFKAALEDARKLLSIDPKHAAANRIAHNCQQALRD